MLFLLFVVPLVLGNTGLVPYQQPIPADICTDMIGVDMDTYVAGISHHVHSITVQDIRYFFNEPEFPEDNNITTINLDLYGPPVRNVPSYPSVFKFPAGAAFDNILRNSDDPNAFMIQGETPLEKMAHQFHMMEMWMEAGKIYQTMKAENMSMDFCPCIVDDAKTGLTENLQRTVGILRNFLPEPLVDGKRVRILKKNTGNKIVKRDAKSALLNSLAYYPWEKAKLQKREAKDALSDSLAYYPWKKQQKREARDALSDSLAYYPWKRQQKREARDAVSDSLAYYPSKKQQKREARNSLSESLSYYPWKKQQKREARDALSESLSYYPWKKAKLQKREVGSSTEKDNETTVGIIPELKDSESWDFWLNLIMGQMKKESPEATTWFAQYIYCKLNYESEQA